MHITTLKHRADFLAAGQSGFRVAKHCVLVQARRRGEEEPSASTMRLGFTATRKLGNAVARNRAKRRLRAAAAQTLPEFGLAGCDYVFVGRDGTLKCAFDDLIRDMKHALKRLAEMMPVQGSSSELSTPKTKGL